MLIVRRLTVLSLLALSCLGRPGPAYAQIAPGDPERSVVLAPAADCRRCSIQLVREVELRYGGEEHGGVGPPGLLARDARGRWYVRNEFSPATRRT